MLEAASSPDVAEIGIEDPDAENADDITVYKKDGAWECYQAKYSVDARQPEVLELLTKSKNNGQSMVRRFHRLWAGKNPGPKITLVTNLPASDADPIARLVDGDDDTVARHLQHAKPGSKEDGLCRHLADHIGITKDETVEFFRDIRFRFRSKNELIGLSKEHMHAAGLCNDDGAVARGTEIVRDWVAEGRRRIDRADLQSALVALKRPPGSTASILIQMIDRDPEPSATVQLDWTRLFPGSEPRARRLPSKPDLWDSEFRPKFREAAQTLRSQNRAHVVVKGYMRLPTWFAVGAELAKTACFEVSSAQGLEEWSSVGEVSRVAAECDVVELGPGRDLAVGIALASDPSPDALPYIRGHLSGVGRYACIRPPGGASNQAVRSAAEARGLAFGVRDSIRNLCGHGPDRVHLFMAAPGGVALLLGHLWNRVPSTQLYEDLGPGKGYSPSYLIPA